MPSTVRGRLVSGALVVFFLASAAFYLVSTLCAIANFAWRQPMFDQWRLYETFLTLPFPENVLQLENGHRPIFPNLIRVAEIHLFNADQTLQIAFGTTCAILTSLLIAGAAVAQKDLPPVARAAGVMLAVLGIFWLANARMLLHGNESVHAYLLTLCVAGASACTYRAGRDGSLSWLIAACTASVGAMFCFGPGAASFVSVIVIGIAMRLPWRWLLWPPASLGVCLLFYLFVLPGDQGVRNMLSLHPIESLRLMAQWLSAPWINGWLGLADPSASWMLVYDDSWGSALKHAANAAVSLSGLSWRVLGEVIAYGGIAGFCAYVLRRLALGGRTLGSWSTLAMGLGVFALASAAIFAIGRLEHIRSNPDQVYADRYLIWPSLFWCACAMLLVSHLARSAKPLWRIAGIAFLVALPIVLLATQRGAAVWGSLVYRSSQQAAAAARSGVFDGDRFPNGPDAPRATVVHALTLFKQRRLAMFATPGWEKVGSLLTGSLQPTREITADARIASTFEDALDHTSAARVEGTLEKGIKLARHSGQLVIIDETRRVVGMAEFSHLANDSSALRLDVPRKRGFDGYIRNYRADGQYQLILLAVNADRAYRLATIGTASGSVPH